MRDISPYFNEKACWGFVFTDMISDTCTIIVEYKSRNIYNMYNSR